VWLLLLSRLRQWLPLPLHQLLASVYAHLRSAMKARSKIDWRLASSIESSQRHQIPWIAPKQVSSRCWAKISQTLNASSDCAAGSHSISPQSAVEVELGESAACCQQKVKWNLTWYEEGATGSIVEAWFETIPHFSYQVNTQITLHRTVAELKESKWAWLLTPCPSRKSNSIIARQQSLETTPITSFIPQQPSSLWQIWRVGAAPIGSNWREANFLIIHWLVACNNLKIIKIFFKLIIFIKTASCSRTSVFKQTL
jgi:hypothetical protein